MVETRLPPGGSGQREQTFENHHSGSQNNIPLREGWWTESESLSGGKEARLTLASKAFNSPAGRAAVHGRRPCLPDIGEALGEAGGRSANPFAAQRFMSIGTYL